MQAVVLEYMNVMRAVGFTADTPLYFASGAADSLNVMVPDHAPTSLMGANAEDAKELLGILSVHRAPDVQ